MPAECLFCGEYFKKGIRSLHLFPFQDENRLNSWLERMGIEGFVPTPKNLLCSDHFEQSCFNRHGNVRLKKNAVPTIFAPRNCDGKKRAHSPTHVIAVKHCRTDVQPAESVHSGTENIPAQNSLDKEIADCLPSTIVCSPTASNNPAVDAFTQCNDSPNTSQKISHDHRYASTPRSARKKLNRAHAKIRRMETTLKQKNKKICRMKNKISTLKNIVSKLRDKKALPESGLACLDSIADSDVSQFLKRFENNAKRAQARQFGPKKRPFKAQRKSQSHSARNKFSISREKYPPALRSFAMTLHFYSPKAYGFVRRKFCNAIPNPSTLRSWYSAIDGEPGFTSESFKALDIKASEAQKVGKEILVALLMDEVGIKKGLTISPNRQVRGFVDIGNGMETDDSVPLAKNALVLMVVALDDSWKIPIGYFLINGIDSETNSAIIVQALFRLHNVGVKVVSVTLDGPAQHFATMRLLGASFEMPNPKPYFSHPVTKQNVYVIFDACHMLKLFRNCLGDYQCLMDADGNYIRWDFITSLAQIQQKEGLRAGNKVRMAHVEYRQMKMKVSLAAQTLSNSAADAIEFCASIGMPQFQGCNATARFMRCIDRLFDFLNSRNPFGKGYKSPLRRSNEGFWRLTILDEIQYLKGIRDSTGASMLKTRRNVPFIGMITAVMAVTAIFDLYVKPENSQLKYLLTYKLSQDHLELFFCAIRSCGGWCPNPTCAQFVSAYKRLLVRHEIESVNGNVEAMDRTTILRVPSGSSKRSIEDRYDPAVYDNMANIRVAKKYGLDETQGSEEVGDSFVEFNQLNRNFSGCLSNFSKSCIGHIGGWVVKKLIDERRPVVQCKKCQNALLQETQTAAEFEDNGLIQAKTRGGLIFPSESVVQICLQTEKLFRHCLYRVGCLPPTESNFPAVLACKVMQVIFQPPCQIFDSLNEHLFDNPLDEPSHTYMLTKHVCITYIKLRLFSATKIASEAAIGRKMRHHMTRQIIWKSQ